MAPMRACALAVAAWLVYRTRASRWARAIQAAMIVLEVSVIVVATMEVSPGSTAANSRSRGAG
jgi:hypothetical protein